MREGTLLASHPSVMRPPRFQNLPLDTKETLLLRSGQHRAGVPRCGDESQIGEKGAPRLGCEALFLPCPLADAESVTELNALLRAHDAEDHRLQRRNVLVRGQLRNQSAQE